MYIGAKFTYHLCNQPDSASDCLTFLLSTDFAGNGHVELRGNLSGRPTIILTIKYHVIVIPCCFIHRCATLLVQVIMDCRYIYHLIVLFIERMIHRCINTSLLWIFMKRVGKSPLCFVCMRMPVGFITRIMV